MSRDDWKSRLGVVYSTDPDFRYNSQEDHEDKSSQAIKNQNLTVLIDRRHREGKQVTIVKGFKGSDKELEELGKTLKGRCGTGGTVKEGEIIIQGDFRDKIVTILISLGHRAKRGN